MESYFKDEVCISIAPTDEPDRHDDAPHAGPSHHALRSDQSSPLLSSRSSLSSATTLDRQDAVYDDEHDASCRDQRRWSGASSETLVGSFVLSHFANLKSKLPSALASTGYKKLASDELGPVTRRVVHRKKTACIVLLLAALMLGIGGRHLHKPKHTSSLCGEGDSFCLSLHDQDSLQDALISVPTLPRPEHPERPEDVLPFDLHHDDTFTVAPLVPPPSAANRRQLNVIPSQSVLLDKQECIEAWVAHGTVCEVMRGVYRQRPDLTGVDLLYTWVNGSDWRHNTAEWMHAYRPTGRWQDYVEEDLFPSSSLAVGASATSRRRHVVDDASDEGTLKLTRRSAAAVESRFRDHQELRYSMRSAAKHLHGLSTIHIVAPDFSAPYHLQPGARAPGEQRIWARMISSLQRRTSDPPFWLSVDRLKEAFVGLPSQLRRVQGLGTDRFTTDEGQIREGQVPQWLSLDLQSNVLAGQEAAAADTLPGTESFFEPISKWFASPSPTQATPTWPAVRLHHDWNAFTDNWMLTEPLTAKQRKQRDDFRRAALPTFNSMAVEAMLGDQPGLHDTFLYSNDDFFLLDDVSVADVSSPLFGPVLRLDYNLIVEGKKSPKPTAGEWSALWHTNWLLDQRFGQRKRPYIHHVHKSFSKSLLQETRMGWAHEHARLGLNRFRNGGDNLVTHF